MQHPGTATLATLVEAGEHHVYVISALCGRLWGYNIERALRAYVFLSPMGFLESAIPDCERRNEADLEDPFAPFYERLKPPTRRSGSANSSKRTSTRTDTSKNAQLSMFHLATWTNSTSAISPPGSAVGRTTCASQRSNMAQGAAVPLANLAEGGKSHVEVACAKCGRGVVTTSSVCSEHTWSRRR